MAVTPINDTASYKSSDGSQREAQGVVILSGGGGGGSGGAVTIADGADVAEGATTSTVYSSSDGSASGTVIGLLKGLYARNFGLGLQNDAAATTDTGTFSLIALFKRLLGYQSTLSTAANKPTAGTNLSGTVTTTSGGFSIPASAARKPGDVQGQNLSGVAIGFNEFGGAAVIGVAGTWTVPAGMTFVITTNQQVNFIAASGTAAVTITSI